TGDDSVYIVPRSAASRHDSGLLRPFVDGESLRDWSLDPSTLAIYPCELPPEWRDDIESGILWPYRECLRSTLYFGEVKESRRLRWSDYVYTSPSKLNSERMIEYAFVSSHNNFSLVRRKVVSNKSAPLIILPSEAGEDEHLELLGVLNSSTACFWLKQVSYPKGGDPIGDEGARVSAESWSDRYEFTGTKLKEFPLPGRLPLDRGREIDALAQKLTSVNPSNVAAEAVPAREALAKAQRDWLSTRRQMIAAQEELDWEVYSLYGLLDEELTAPEHAVPELNLGERAFEIVLARKMATGEVETEWFARHGSTPIIELPAHWPAEYRAVVERRIALIESDRNIALIERPECKRRWATEGFDAMREKALQEWLLDRFERRELWFDHMDGMEQPKLLTTAQLADALRPDADVVAVAELYAPGKDLEKVVAELVTDEHVPYLAALRYKESGLRKRADWEHIWDLQRQEDAADSEEAKKRIRDRIPVPPKYGSGDFLKTSYWRNRGKLDVPKERFISYPYASRDGASSTKDGTLLLGWAGFDHREQAQALATLIMEREQGDGWGAEKLRPLLAGLREVLPWVRQWHGKFDALYGASPAEVYEGFLDQTKNRLNLTDEDLTGWRPPATGRGRGKRAQS
ncbi:BREX-2 system adenine-specific DNA-methyltransferase PglX, partial [Planomonospora parontospora]